MGREVNDEVYALFQEDQGDRQDVSSRWHDKEWTQRLKVRDRLRRRGWRNFGREPCRQGLTTTMQP